MADNEKEILFKIKLEENRLTRQLKDIKDSVDDLDRRTRKYKDAVREQVSIETKLAQVRSQRASINRNLSNSIGGLSKSQEQLKNSSGGATSAVLELGRVVQDAPYGIRGMANNLSQLVSQMAFATKSAGGFGAALKQVWAAMLGPFGIVLAISAVISVLDGMYGGMKKADGASEDLNKSLIDEVGTLREYKTALDDSNLSLEEREGIIKAATVSSPEFLKIIKESGLALDEQASALRRYIAGKEKELLISEKVSRLDSVNKELRDSEIKGVEALIEKRSELQRVLASIRPTQESQGAIRTIGVQIDKLNDLIDKYKEQKELRLEINDLVEDENEVAKYSAKWYKQEISRLEKLRESTARNKNEWNAVTIAINAAKKSLEKITGSDKKKDRANALDLFDPIDPREQAKKAREKLDVAAKYIGVDLKENPLGIPLELNLKLTEETQERIRKDSEGFWKRIFSENKLEEIADFAKQAMAILSSITDFIDSEFERELTLEQNKTTALNNELNQRLLNENLSKSERANIQNEIAKNDEALRKKQEAIEKKRFEMNKAANIAKAVVDTYTASVAALKNNGGVPTGIPAMLGTIAVGLAQVAAISRQQFQSSAGSATPIKGLGSSGGEGDRSFNYNLVGNNQANQIAEALQGQFSNPLKAYVVSRDVTTQQELDMNIKSGASF